MITTKPTTFNQIVVLFTAFVALITVYELSYSNKVAQMLKGVSSTMHHASLLHLACKDPTGDMEFEMYDFVQRKGKKTHPETLFLNCKKGYKPKSTFRRGEITCWTGEWIWLTSVLECEKA
uniref:Uncharacterized protein n=1 Tax=Lotharella oceanica TaxID=641309 RepID=A0A7S2TXT3_9EUKA|mmetsp:Transcript_34719/g.64270  ORF Transcript_34719/g.64270 Transcript_34719/m.64270 type:complete len:121 (+) Transcript_34719:46-408(+)